MAKPSGGDYQAALQHPNTVFQDAELRQALPVKNKLGLPNLLSGNFAVVCHLHSPTNAWAVRCFVREIAGLAQRYRAITQYLQGTRSLASCLVDFRYLDQGILVKGAREPIVVMEWISGTPLDRAVDEAIGQSKSLQPLLEKWLALDQELAELGIAHGDLQHGNVLVQANSALRLVDYDGMFVPALTGEKASDVGHPNYQNPHRTKDDFDANADRFSALVIYTALLALHHDPSLWTKYRMPDDAMLFRRQDLIDPIRSPLFADLYGIGDPALTRATDLLKQSAMTGRLVPWLTDLHPLLNAGSWLPASTAGTAPDKSLAGSSPPVSGWWRTGSDVEAPQIGAMPTANSDNESTSGWWKDGHDLNKTSLSEPQQKPLFVVPSWTSQRSLPVPGNGPGRSHSGSGGIINAVVQPLPATSQAGSTGQQTNVIASQTSGKCHLVSCYHVQKIPRTKRMTFTSFADANKQGYEPCKVCRPDVPPRAVPIGQKSGTVSSRTQPALLSRLSPPSPQNQSWLNTASTAATPSKPTPKVVPAVPIPSAQASVPSTSKSQSMKPKVARVGSRVTIRFFDGGEFSFLLVGLWERQSRVDHVAADSSLGKAVIGATIGRTITYEELGIRNKAEVIAIS